MARWSCMVIQLRVHIQRCFSFCCILLFDWLARRTTTPPHHHTTTPSYHNTTIPQHHNTTSPHYYPTTFTAIHSPLQSLLRCRIRRLHMRPVLVRCMNTVKPTMSSCSWSSTRSGQCSVTSPMPSATTRAATLTSPRTRRHLSVIGNSLNIPLHIHASAVW